MPQVPPADPRRRKRLTVAIGIPVLLVLGTGAVGAAVLRDGGGTSSTGRTATPSGTPTPSPAPGLDAAAPTGPYRYADRLTATDDPGLEVGETSEYDVTLSLDCGPLLCTGPMTFQDAGDYALDYDGITLRLSAEYDESYPCISPDGTPAPAGDSVAYRVTVEGELTRTTPTPASFSGSLTRIDEFLRVNGGCESDTTSPMTRAERAVTLTPRSSSPVPDVSTPTVTTTPAAWSHDPDRS